MALPRPHRFDVYIAAGGLLGGLLLVGLGLGTRPSSDPITLFDGPWPVLVPLTVLAGCELLRRTALARPCSPAPPRSAPTS